MQNEIDELTPYLTEQDRDELAAIQASGRIDFEAEPTLEFEGRRYPLHEGQRIVWNCVCRFIGNPAGWQSGKTEPSVYWLAREVQRKGPGDYAVVGPTLPILGKKVIPVFTRILGRKLGLGEFKEQKKVFKFSKEGMNLVFGLGDHEPTTIWFLNGEDSASLEAATYKGAVGEELGATSVPLESWDVLKSRLAVHNGRVLFTSRPYSYDHWYYREIFQKADFKWSWQVQERGDDPQVLTSGDPNGRIGIVNYSSLMNPAFPEEEYWLEKESMAPYRHGLKYDGLFSKPGGAIYGCFDRKANTYDPRKFKIPDEWPRHLGMDFGEVNTAAVFIAEDPDTLDLYVYGSYHTGSCTVDEHAARIRQKALGHIRLEVEEDADFSSLTGGSWSENDWRGDYWAAGLPVERPPVREIEVQIARVYRQFKTGKLKISTDLAELIAEIESYSREVDDRGEPLQKINNEQDYHRHAGLRYSVSHLRRSLEADQESSTLPVEKKPEPREADKARFDANTAILEHEREKRGDETEGWKTPEIA